jgi:hypothetical protein
MLTDEWCDTPIKVHEAEAIFDTSLKMLFITTGAKCCQSDTVRMAKKCQMFRT